MMTNKLYYVYTHLGRYETVAVSPKKAIANVRYRLAGRQCNMKTTYWEAKEA